MRLLLTNDDGVLAPGMAVLARRIASWTREAPPGDERRALIVAPNRNYSGMSSAVGDVFERPTVAYRRHRIAGAESITAYGLEAPPALCAILGALGSFDFVPDVIISGINAGANVGRSVLHSGTVGAVFTGAQLGLSGLAVSVQWGDEVHYDTAAEVAVELLDELFRAPARTVLNLNVPNLELHQLKGVRRGHISSAGVIKAAGPRAGGEALSDEGELPLRLGAASPSLGDVSDEGPNDDGALVEAGYASLTPLHGPHEVTDPDFDALMEQALEAASRQLSQ